MEEEITLSPWKMLMANGLAFGVSLAAGWLIFYSKELYLTESVSLNFLFLFFGLLLSVCFILGPIIGYLSDNTFSRLGKRKPYLILSVCIAAFSFWMTLFNEQFLLWTALFIIAVYLAFLLFRAFLIDLVPKNQRLKGFIYQMVLVSAAVAIVAFSTTAVHFFYKPSIEMGLYFKRWFYITDIVILLSSVLWVIWVIKEKYPPYEPLEEILDASPMISFKNGFFEFKDNVKQLFVKAPYLLTSIALSWLGFWMMLLFLPPVIRQLSGNSVVSMNSDWFYIYFSTFVFFCCLFSILLPWLTQKLSCRTVYMGVLCAGGLSLVSMDLVNALWQIVLVMAGVGIVFISMMCLPYEQISNDLPEDKIGAYLGILEFLSIGPGLLIGIIAWSMGKYSLGYQNAMIVFGGAAMLLAAFVMRGASA